jgi:hypothetical protein
VSPSAPALYSFIDKLKHIIRKWLEVKPESSSSHPNVGAIIAGVFGGLALVTAIIIWVIIFRKRKSIPHVEEGVKERPKGWPDLKSEFSPDEKSGRRFDRIRNAFGRRGLRNSQQSILPVYQVSLSPGSMRSINRPETPAPAHIPRYPSMLERSHNRPRPPPPLGVEFSRMSSMSDSIRSAGPGDRASRRKVQIPPKVLLVPSPGRPLPGFADRRIGGSRSPKSAPGRKSWLSKRLSRHPFIPLRDPDPSIHFAPGSPLHPDHYQPSRELLEARLDIKSPRTPRTPMTPRTPRREPVRRLPVPLYEDEIGATTKSARLVEALHGDGNRTPVPPASGKHPPNSSTPYI